METHIAAAPQGLPSSLDTIIRVNRAKHPDYPNWIGEEGWNITHPELECVGPAEYGLGNLRVMPSKQDGLLTARDLYHRVKSRKDTLGFFGLTDTSPMGLGGCLGLADGNAILEKDITIFDEFFPGDQLWLLRSTVDRQGTLMTPCIFRTSRVSEYPARLAIQWSTQDTRVSRRSITAHFLY